jgi:hypothetical protein
MSLRPTLDDCINDLLRQPTQSPNRLSLLSQYCIAELKSYGLDEVREGDANEVRIPGLSRIKDWDVAYVMAGKPRLLISLKSILKNLAGTIPNRLDDLMGEAANVQQLSPEIVVGYIVLVDEAGNSSRREGDGSWVDYFSRSLRNIAIRKAPLWNQGLIEAVWLVHIDSRRPEGDRLMTVEGSVADGRNFFDDLVKELRRREPSLLPSAGALR